MIVNIRLILSGLAACAALCATPGTGLAQIFETNLGNGTIGEYTTSGATVNASLVTGLDGPQGLAVSGGDLFVVNRDAGTIGEYDATSGATVNAALVSGLNNNPTFIDVVAVPEPSTWSMIAVGGVALLGIMCRKKHRTA